MDRDTSGWPMDRADDAGSDVARDHGDSPAPAWRDRAPDPLAPLDPDGVVSGHTPAAPAPVSMADAPEHDWGAASSRLFPIIRPAGTPGLRVETLDPRALESEGLKSHAQPLVDEGPAGLSVVYGLTAGGYDVIVSADHLLSWGVTTADVQDAAIANLRAWSAAAPWEDERSGSRRLVSSQSGEGWDASRILLPEVGTWLSQELGSDARILVGLPERHLLVAGALVAGDEEFAALLADFVIEHSGSADEPIDRGLFELVAGTLVRFV
jgi:uncharacterized protein YtpQ (UPF0354 family)